MTRIILALAATTLVLNAQEAAKLKAKLDQLPKPWVKKLHRLSADEYEATIRHWEKKHPKLLTVEVPGRTREGEPLYLLKITDPDFPDNDKQIALISALHGGPERSGTTTAMHCIEWMLSDDAEAKETRRKQIVLFMPIMNPYAYFKTDRFGNSVGIDPYTGADTRNWNLEDLTYKQADEVPEIKAFIKVVDEYKPEVHHDLHGTGLQEYTVDLLGTRQRYAGQTMIEISGSAYSNYALRPWDWRVTDAMNAAGEAEGYPYDRFEADMQRSFWSPDLRGRTQIFWRGRPRFYTSQYAFAKYHTMTSCLEVGWEKSGLARTKGLLRIGNGIWPTRNQPGYPVDRLGGFIGHFITAYGKTASQRRTSREELWKLQEQIDQAILYPQTEGRIMYVAAVGKTAASVFHDRPHEFAIRLKKVPGVDVEVINTFMNAGPEVKLAIFRPHDRNADGAVIENGIGFHLRIPYQNPKIADVRVNGHELKNDLLDGWTTWNANAYTHMKINIPPAKAKKQNMYIITCAYRPDVKREYGWVPPKEVLNKLGQ
tara:strand:- start:7170 stop:8792 length:1623 start_codon:yes stop_codon:yes gene_type:complete